MKTIYLTLNLFLLLVVCTIATIAQTPRVSAAIKQIPLNGKTTTDFVPRGWELYNEASEDLDGDNVMDAAITLTLPIAEAEKLKDAGGDNYESAPSIIVVLFGKPGGGYRRFAVNGRLYPDNSDYRSYLDNTITKGVLTVGTNWGDGWASDIKYRFRYDRTKGKLMLIGFDSERYDLRRSQVERELPDGSSHRLRKKRQQEIVRLHRNASNKNTTRTGLVRGCSPCCESK